MQHHNKYGQHFEQKCKNVPVVWNESQDSRKPDVNATHAQWKKYMSQ